MCFASSSGECEQVLVGHSGGIVWAVSRSSDGRYVFSASANGTVKIWEVTIRKYDQTLSGHEGPAVLTVSVASDSSKVMTGGSDNSLIEWDSAVERSAIVLDGHNKPIW
jgi:WD40 repeat protein